MKEKRWFSFLTIVAIYVIAITCGYLLYQKLEIKDVALKLLIVDVLMTIIVFIGSLVFRNASIYDPYWSVIPMIVVLYFGFANFKALNLVMIIPVLLWGARLTINWAIRFKNLYHVDFRYVHFKQKFPKIWPVINFFGIHLFPTMVVYLMMLPMIAYFEPHQYAFNVSSIVSVGLMLMGIIIEAISDYQMMKFKKNLVKNGETPTFIYTGLWKKSRHPNYFGEIAFWFGVYLLMLSVFPASSGGGEWALFVGPLVNLVMFVFISIPLMEKKLLKKYPDYLFYQKNTNALMPFFPKTKEDITL